MKGEDVILRGERAGLSRTGFDISWKSPPHPAPEIQMCTRWICLRSQGPPPSQGENPTSGEHLDQTATMKAHHQTRASERPSPQALLQEKLQIFLL